MSEEGYYESKLNEFIKLSAGKPRKDFLENMDLTVKAETDKEARIASKLVDKRAEYEANSGVENPKPKIEIPGNGRTQSNFAKEVGKHLSKENRIFFRSDLMEVVEIGKIERPDGQMVDKGFISLSNNPSRFITILENYFNPYKEVHNNGSIFRIPKSITKSDSDVVINSPQMQNQLPLVERIFRTPFPIEHNGELTFPKRGYDKRFCSWLPDESPEIIDPEMSLDEAKKIIFYIFKEFCFKEKKDFTNAVAALITPFLRGLFSKFSTRTPLFAYIANRERAGKDYLAGVRQIVFEGQSIEETPISSGEQNRNQNEELRKKILSTFKQGRKFFHSANNKGLIDNSVLEAILTSQVHSDRVLGSNQIATFSNELDFSLSGNIGISFTPDLTNRTKFINLFLDIEDANKRKFENPNLHQWVHENRERILSALYSMVKTWYEKGKPSGSHPFSSYPEWAEICGGVMEACGFENPCATDESGFNISLDSETEEMKQLFEYMYKRAGEKWLQKRAIVDNIRNSSEDLFSYINWDNRSDQTKFGKRLEKFVGRFLSNIRLTVKDENVRASRREYMFTKEKPEKDKSLIFGEEFSQYLENPKNEGSQ